MQPKAPPSRSNARRGIQHNGICLQPGVAGTKKRLLMALPPTTVVTTPLVIHLHLQVLQEGHAMHSVGRRGACGGVCRKRCRQQAYNGPCHPHLPACLWGVWVRGGSGWWGSRGGRWAGQLSVAWGNGQSAARARGQCNGVGKVVWQAPASVWVCQRWYV